MHLCDNETLTQSLKRCFERHRDAADATQMEAYMKGIAPFYGLKAPQRRACLANSWKGFDPNYVQLEALVRDWWQKDEREWHYSAMELLFRHKKVWPMESIELIEWLIRQHSWWDTVDMLAAKVAGYYFQQHPDQTEKVIPEWINHQNMWINRSAILFQLGYKANTNTDLLRKTIVPHLASKQFFHQKAIGWALRQHTKTDPEWVRQFVQSNKLKPLSLREAKKYL